MIVQHDQGYEGHSGYDHHVDHFQTVALSFLVNMRFPKCSYMLGGGPPTHDVFCVTFLAFNPTTIWSPYVSYLVGGGGVVLPDKGLEGRNMQVRGGRC
jgi:hypothetical protein